MKLDSKYFDSIRVAPKRQRAEQAREERPCCQWKGCRSPGLYRAPRGRGRDGQYYIFCIDHVRQYNASYNYFDGMNDREVEDFQKDALTGHRPTWNVGLNLSNKSKQGCWRSQRQCRSAARDVARARSARLLCLARTRCT